MKIKERGIIFNGEMVRAILDGRKTQTRRILSPRQLKMIDTASSIGECYPLDCGIRDGNSQSYYREWCPFGKVGDRLWVKETFATLGNEDGHPIDWENNLVSERKDSAKVYRASCYQMPNNYGLWTIPDRDSDFEGPWTPSSQMPRWASRITLEITDIRVERLQSISERDAWKEGFEGYDDDFTGGKNGYSELTENWINQHGQDSWQYNPFVWVVEFKRVEVDHEIKN